MTSACNITGTLPPPPSSYPCGKAIESRTHIVAECELYQEERDVLEGEMRDLNKSGMESFDALDSREKMIAILEMVATDVETGRG